LGFGRRSVDLVGQQQVRKYRSRHKPQAAAGASAFLVEDFRAGDVGGHQVGCELDAVEGQIQNVSQAAHQQRLREPRHAQQQAVSAGEDGDQHLIDHLFLADNHFADFRLDGLMGGGDVFQLFRQ